ncbi:MAG: beta-lactamase family protein [Thermoanaerobaculaceae bacterium]|mgnify:CR=1 FL=1|nr:beta-lactamase family protein [Thermoanaerobaculaceae bacterium]MDI9622189.1 serine hydrolase domain-containing protein [Acidobacteriota bacterium]NLH12618.1 beta-lactamase family protein [Holophagae bacterium]HPW54912.1 serine hydrolase domain-containing protein [Thermoanaerobaculaceae bacterium]
MTDREDWVGRLLTRATAAGLACGWVAAALHEGEAGACWVAGRREQGGEAVGADLWFDLASLTKPLVTTTLLLLARRDGLELRTPLAEVLAELGGSPWAGVTLEQCACHTTGFPAWEPLYSEGTGAEAYLACLAKVQPVAAPGEHVLYSCLGFIALGLALERAAGADLATLTQALILEPLGLLEECGFAPPRRVQVAAGEREWFVERRLLADRGVALAPPAGRAGAWACDDGNARGLDGAAGNAGLFGSAAAVARLAAEYLPGGGELVTAQEAELATRCCTDGLEQARGLGWQLAATPGCSAGPGLAPEAFGHTGFTGVSVWVEPADRMVLVLLGNRLHPGGRTPDLHPLRRTFHLLARTRRRG